MPSWGGQEDEDEPEIDFDETGAIAHSLLRNALTDVQPATEAVPTLEQPCRRQDSLSNDETAIGTEHRGEPHPSDADVTVRVAAVAAAPTLMCADQATPRGTRRVPQFRYLAAGAMLGFLITFAATQEWMLRPSRPRTGEPDSRRTAGLAPAARTAVLMAALPSAAAPGRSPGAFLSPPAPAPPPEQLPSSPPSQVGPGLAARDQKARRQFAPRQDPTMTPTAIADLAMAEAALARRDTFEALRLARHALQEGRPARAFSLLTRAHCQAGDLGNAVAAFRSVAPHDRATVRRACAAFHVGLAISAGR
jgi:serine/threonine-protein kinase